MEAVEWYEENSHKPNWVKRVPESQNKVVAPKPILGEEDANTEWAQGASPQQLFSPIESYRDIQESDNLFLFGRRGTGKTALLRMLHYEVTEGRKEFFSSSTYVAPKETIDELTTLCKASHLRSLGAKETTHFLTKCWLWLLQSHALVTWGKTDYLQISPRKKRHPDDLTRALTKHLAAKIAENIGQCQKPEDLARHMIDFENDLFSDDFEHALEDLANDLTDQDSTILVLVDTEEIYPVHDDIASTLRTALIDAVLRIYNRYKLDRIIAKAAFPSEILPHMRPINREKTVGKSVVIFWSYRDLVRLLAKRFLRAFRDSDDAGYDQLTDYSRARELLLEFFPESIKTRNGLWFDTIAYIIRHTQKKPRQALLLMNTIFTLVETEGAKPEAGSIKSEMIVNGVHERLDLLVKGSLDIYHDIYDHAEQLVRVALGGARSYFSASDLDKLLKATNALRSEGGLSKQEVRRLLLESGVIGVASDVNEFGEFRTQVVECLFEYQVKGVMNIPANAVCVVHPMFLGELHILVDKRVFSYPRPFEDEERKVLRNVGLG